MRRTLATWLILVLLALPLLAACGGGDDNDTGDDPTPGSTSGTPAGSPTVADGAQPTATPPAAGAGASPSAPGATATSAGTTPAGGPATATSAAPTSTPLPQPQPQPQTAVPATATTGNAPGDATATPTASSGLEPTAAPEDPTLDGYLVNLDDLGPGWVEVEDVDGDDNANATICGAQSIDPSFEPQARARASHEGEILGPFLEQRIALFANADEAAAVFDQMRTALSCSSWTDSSDPAAPVTWTVQALTIAPVGDDSHARRVFAVTDEFELIGDLVVVRQGAYLFTVFLLDLGSVETALTEEFAATIAGRIP